MTPPCADPREQSGYSSNPSLPGAVEGYWRSCSCAALRPGAGGKQTILDHPVRGSGGLRPRGG
eukprot:4779619-Pyramimonas_sp.AAC.1